MAPFQRAAISPLALVLGLWLLAMALVVAAAAEGRFDRLPARQYFPAQLWEPATVVCEGREAADVQRYSPLDDRRAVWFSSQLRAADEPSLYLESKQSPDARSIRFTWLRTFHAPVVIRVDALANGEMRLTAKQLSGHGGYAPGRIAARVQRTLSREESARLERILAEGRILALTPNECGGGSDGAHWIFEANERGSYHYLMRFSPEAGTVRDTGLLLMSFTGWAFDPVL